MTRDIRTFELDSEQLKLKKILSKKFLELEMDIINDDNPNNNGTYFTIESMQKNINEDRISDIPILGYFDTKSNDFVSHEGQWKKDNETKTDFWDTQNGERILGTVREKDKKEIIEKDGKHWLTVTSAIFIQYAFKQVKRLLKDKNKKVSVEIDVLKSHMARGVNPLTNKEEDIEVIEDFELLGITILGSRNGRIVKEGIENAHLSILDEDYKEVFQKQRQALSFEYKELDAQDNDEQSADKEECEAKLEKEKKSEESIINKEIKPVLDCSECKDIELAKKLQIEDSEKNNYPCDGLNKNNEMVYGVAADSQLVMDGKTKQENKQLEKCHELEAQCDDYAKRCSEYDIRCEKYEEQIKTYKAQCDEYIQKCSTYEAKIEELNKQCSTKTEECEAANAKITDYESIKSDYESVKEKLKAAQTEIFNRDCEKMKFEAMKLMANENLPAEEVNLISEKCMNGEYKTFESLKRDIAVLVFDKQHINLNIHNFEMPIIGQGIEPPHSVKKQRKSALQRLKEEKAEQEAQKNI